MLAVHLRQSFDYRKAFHRQQEILNSWAMGFSVAFISWAITPVRLRVTRLTLSASSRCCCVNRKCKASSISIRGFSLPLCEVTTQVFNCCSSNQHNTRLLSPRPQLPTCVIKANIEVLTFHISPKYSSTSFLNLWTLTRRGCLKPHRYSWTVTVRNMSTPREFMYADTRVRSKKL